MVLSYRDSSHHLKIRNEIKQIKVRKHDLDFYTSVIAFLDPLRIIAVDEKHSFPEERLFCVGRIGKVDGFPENADIDSVIEFWLEYWSRGVRPPG